MYMKIRSVFSCLLISAVSMLAARAADQLEGRAVLPAATFAQGPTSGQQLGPNPINGQPVPFLNKQPVQGFSAVQDNGDGTFNVMPDNGFGALENSADFHLRVYHIQPDFKTKDGGSGTISVLGFFELRDPDKRIPFTITEQFTDERVLTGADFDIESMQRAADGTLWFGDEFGPFLLHTDASGKVLEAPFHLPDFGNPGKEIRAPQNPFNEEATTVRIMNAARHHARLHGNNKAPICSPWEVMLDDGNANTFVDNRQAPPVGSGLAPASSEIHNIASIQAAGYPVVTYTVDNTARMTELLTLKINGIISDRSDLLYGAVASYDANGDGTPGDYLDADGLIDIAKIDAQGHRGSRDLRPENTLPAMEAGLDNLMTTLETDCGITSDGVPILSHDPHIQAQKCSRTDGVPYEDVAAEVLIKDLTVAEIQEQFRCDKLFRGPTQQNDPALSPVTVAFFGGDASQIYVLPTLQQLFDFVTFYTTYYRTGPGSGHPMATKRWKNAQRVRFNVETKVNPRTDEDPLHPGQIFALRTIEPTPFAQKVANVIVSNGMQERADIQSFDFRTLLVVQEQFPQIRTVYLFGDFPKFDDPAIAGSDDGTNMQPQAGAGPNTPWMAGMFWPYRSTKLTQPFRAQTSGGFEGMALTPDKHRLLPLLEKPLAGDDQRTILMHEFDLASSSYTGNRFKYQFDPRGVSIGDFILTDEEHGLIIERDNTQGDLNGFKAVYKITLGAPGTFVNKELAVDLLRISDPHRISEPGQSGDVGIGRNFAFPFTTIEDVLFFDQKHIGILNDNNFPFSVGRHVGSGQPDDEEFIIIKLDRPL